MEYSSSRRQRRSKNVESWPTPTAADDSNPGTGPSCFAALRMTINCIQAFEPCGSHQGESTLALMPECTKTACKGWLVERLDPPSLAEVLTLRADLPTETSKSAHSWPNLPLPSSLSGKLGEGSDKLGPIVGNQAESSDRRATIRPWYLSPRFIHFGDQG